MADVTRVPPTRTFVITTADFPCATLKTPRWWGNEVNLGGGKLLVAGGLTADNVDLNPKHEVLTNAVEVLDLTKCTSQSLPYTLHNHAGSQPVVLSPGRALMFGGMHSDKIDIVKGDTIHHVGTLQAQRSAAASVALSDGRVLITGGYSNVGDKAAPVNAVEVFDPKTAKSTVVASMTIPRASHSLTPIGGGKYLLVGGACGAKCTESFGMAEIFDEKTMTFTRTTESPKVSRKDHRAVADNSGRVWLIGGTDQKGQSHELIEFYDTRTGKFKVIQDELGEGREDVAATFIPELNVIVVVGGERKGQHDGRKDPPSNLVEVLDLNTALTSGRSVSVGFLKHGERDEPTLHVLSADKASGTAELLVLQGLSEMGGQKTVPAPEKIKIKIK